jgi:hypothetical protein
MTRMRHISRFVAAAAVAASSVSCGDVVRDGKAPMFLVIDSLAGARDGTGIFANPLISDVLTELTTPEPCTTLRPCYSAFNDNGQATLRIVPKNIGNAAVRPEPSTNNEVTINRFRVVYKRADGRNTPGVDVPYAFDSVVTGTVPIGGTRALTFELVRHAAKQEAPLVNLVVNNTTILNTIADVTFYGQDRVGNEISVTGSIQIDFGNFR